MLTILLFVVFGYLCGSIPFGKILGNFHGVDIQKKGSGNIGFANVRRVLGWKIGLITLAGDILKGALPTGLAQLYQGTEVALLVGFCAILGHVFPIWLRFRGGKGIATGLGVIFIVLPYAAAIGSAIYVIGSIVTKKSGQGSVLGLASVIITSLILDPVLWWYFLLLGAFACWTLRHNFTRKHLPYAVK